MRVIVLGEKGNELFSYDNVTEVIVPVNDRRGVRVSLQLQVGNHKEYATIRKDYDIKIVME